MVNTGNDCATSSSVIDKIAINIRIGLIINFAISVATTRERVMKEKHAATVRRSRLLALVRFVTILSQNGWSILEKFVLLLIKLLIKIAINIRIGLIINFAVSVATTREMVMKEI